MNHKKTNNANEVNKILLNYIKTYKFRIKYKVRSIDE